MRERYTLLELKKLHLGLQWKRAYSEIAIGIAVCLALAPFTWDSDMQIWYIVSKDIGNGLTPYASGYFSYPPIWAYISYFVTFHLNSAVGSPSFANIINPNYNNPLRDALSPDPVFVTTPTFNLLVKLPLIFAYALVGLLIYEYLTRCTGDGKKALSGMRLWLFNPLVLYVSAVAGQFDVLPALCVFIGTILFVRKNYSYSAIALAIGTMLKLFPVYIALLFSVLLFVNSIKPILTPNLSGWTRRIRYLATFVGSFVIGNLLILVPLYFTGALTGFIYANSLRYSIFPGAGGATIFDLIYAPRIENIVSDFLVQNLKPLSTGLLIGSIAITTALGLFSWKRVRLREEDIFALVLISGCIALFSLLTVNPQYILWILPVVIIVYSTKGFSKRWIWVLSVCMTVFGLLWNFPLAPLAFSSSRGVSQAVLSMSQIYTVFIDSYLFPKIAALTGLLSALILYRFVHLSAKTLVERLE